MVDCKGDRLRKHGRRKPVARLGNAKRLYMGPGNDLRLAINTYVLFSTVNHFYKVHDLLGETFERCNVIT